MTRYAYDKFVRLENGIIIDREDLKIFASRPLTAIAFHRNLQDVFDQSAWMLESNPTIRLTDDHIQMQPPWTMGNPEYIGSGLLEHIEVVEFVIQPADDVVREKKISWIDKLFVFISKQF